MNKDTTGGRLPPIVAPAREMAAPEEVDAPRRCPGRSADRSEEIERLLIEATDALGRLIDYVKGTESEGEARPGAGRGNDQSDSPPTNANERQNS